MLHTRALILLLSAISLIPPSSNAMAATDTCSKLAERYSKELSKLSDAELAELRTCVTDALRLRQQGPGVDNKKTMPMANNPVPKKSFPS